MAGVPGSHGCEISDGLGGWAGRTVTPDFPVNAAASGHIRTFVALPLPEPVLAALRRLQQTLESQSRPEAVRWTPASQLHLTLKFLGGVRANRLAELEAALTRVCRQAGRFNLSAENTGSFPDLKRPRVIWVGVGGDLAQLENLQRAVDRASSGFGDHDEARAFSPHLTLGRVRTSDNRERRRIGVQVESLHVGRLGQWSVGEVRLLRSELSSTGAVHRCLASIPLSGRA